MRGGDSIFGRFIGGILVLFSKVASRSCEGRRGKISA